MNDKTWSNDDEYKLFLRSGTASCADCLHSRILIANTLNMRYCGTGLGESRVTPYRFFLTLARSNDDGPSGELTLGDSIE